MRLISIILFVFALAACKKNTAENSNHETAILPENGVILSNEQVKLANIAIGKIEKRLLSETIDCYGTIEVPPNSLAVVSAPMGGFIRNAPYYHGNYVSKGTVLATLEHSDYISLQQTFLETKNQLDYYQQDFKRQGELTIENASSIKKMQQAQADYRIIEVKYHSLKAQLNLIGINADSLNVDGIKSVINIRAPISGNISKVNAVIGKFSGSNEVMYEIINNKHLHLHLKIFQKDIAGIKKGQSVGFWLMNDQSRRYQAEMSSVGQVLEEESNTFSLHAHIKSSFSDLKPGMHVFASVSVSNDSVFSLPAEAVLTINNRNYIFILSNSVFFREEVETGRNKSDFIELINIPELLYDDDIVVSGAYYLNAELEAE